MVDLLDDASLPSDKQGLEAELEEVLRRLEQCQAEVARLLAAENPAQGVFFAADIHREKQKQALLRYQRDLRVARLNQLKFRGEEEV